MKGNFAVKAERRAFRTLRQHVVRSYVLNLHHADAFVAAVRRASYSMVSRERCRLEAGIIFRASHRSALAEGQEHIAHFLVLDTFSSARNVSSCCARAWLPHTGDRTAAGEWWAATLRVRL